VPPFLNHNGCSMEITQNNIDELNAVVKIRLEQTDYFPQYESALSNYRKQVNMPGFRPGKVPMGLVKKQYGRAILAEEINKVLGKSLNQHIEDKELKVLGNPIPKESENPEGDWDNPSSFEFEYELGLAPNVEIKLSKRKAFDFYVIKVDDKLIDKQVTEMTRRYGQLSDPDSSGESDLLMGTFVELDKKGEIKEGGLMHDATVSLEFIEDKKTAKRLVGLTKGDKVVVDPHKVSKNHDDLARMLDITHEQTHDITTDFQLTINEIKRLTPAELNQETFDKVFGEGVVSDEKAFRAKIQKDLEDMFTKDSDRLFKRDFSKALIEQIDPKLPADFLKRWIAMANEKPLSAEQIEAEWPQYEQSLKWQLIENEVVKANDIDVSMEEISNHAVSMIAQQYAQYGMPLQEEHLKTLAANALGNDKERQRIAELLYEDKVVDLLKEQANIREKKVSYDEFLKLANAE
jgi:trigger factor